MNRIGIGAASVSCLAVALLAGCATLNESECHTVDWRELGRSDGAHGYEASRLGEHIEACGKYGITPDAAAYGSGREEGLQLYCQPTNAVNEGRSGNSYRSVCPGERNLMFSHYYQRGLALRQLDADVGDISSALDAQRQAMNDCRDLDLYKMLNQNARYLEAQLRYTQDFLDHAERDVAADRDPRPYSAGRWQNDLPYPDALDQARRAQNRQQHKGDDTGARS